MTINELANRIKTIKSAQIFCHHRPDGDTLSCAFALKKALERLGKSAEVVSVDGVPKKYAECNFFGRVFGELKQGFEAYIAVDCAASDMLGKNETAFLKQQNTFVIDHHGTNTRFAKTSYVDALASCSMIIYELIKALGVEVDKDLADTLLLGIVTDTGNFAHANSDAYALRSAAELIERGANLTEINRLMFKNQSKARSDLYLEVMKKMRFFHENRLAIIFTSRQMLKEKGLERSETEGFVDYPMTISSVEVTAAIMESGDNAYKISLRSKNVDVSEIAKTFGGGGHKNASGFMLFGFFEDVVDKIVFTIGNYL